MDDGINIADELRRDLGEPPVMPSVEEAKPKEPPKLELSEEQAKAADLIEDWYLQGKSKEFKLGGYAGTGKTTLIKHIKDERIHELVIVCSFTGKAVSVLQRKGVRAQTMHRTLYNVREVFDNKGHATGQVEFIKKDFLEPEPSVIIVDEASMVSQQLYEDLKSFKVPVLFVGDPGQLEPVGDNPNLMAEPDFVLEKIHRQAEKSPIIKIANDTRLGVPLFHQEHEGVSVRRKQLNASEAVAADQVICAKNQTRRNLNDVMRLYKGLPQKTIAIGDKIIVLRNNQMFGVFNGQIFFVTEIRGEFNDHWKCDLEDELGSKRTNLPIWKLPFQEELPKDKFPHRGVIWADFGYAITCHKSQGSEWKHVLVYDEWMPPKVWDMKRWRYTAITRASEKLTYLV